MEGWHVAERGGKAQGPFPTEKVLQLWRTGQVRAKTLCWRQGQPDWRPLYLVEPFATAIRQEQAQRRKKVILRILGGLLLGIGIALAGVIGWRYWQESADLQRFQDMMAEGRLQEAQQSLRDFRTKTYFFRSEAEYLLAAILLRMDVLSSSSSPETFSEAEGILRKLAQSSARWWARISSELGRLLCEIPHPTPEALASTEAAKELAKAERVTELFRQLDLPEPEWPDWLKNEKRFAEIVKEAQAAMEKQDYQTAIRRLEEALGIKPAHSEVKQRLRDSKQSLADRHLKNVDALCHTGKFSEAQQELQEVFKILSDHPKATELQTKLATVSQLTQEAQQAERQAEQAEKEEEKIKSYQTAFAFWKQAQEILPDNPFLIAAKEKARQKAGIPPEPEGPKKPEEKPEPPPPIVDQRTLEDKLREHKMVISTSTQVEAAVRNKQTRIIELADTCTYSQFDAQQANLLRDWVRNGGILWVNNDVLNGIFGITYSRITNPLFWGAVTTPAGGSSPILKGVKKVYLTDLEDKSFNLAFPKSIPLLATEDVLGFSGGKLRPGDTLWSLVPYGKGWISDPKPIRFDKGEGSVFWTNFVLFCLGELKIEIEIDDSKRGGGDHPPLTLTGMWQATTGEEFFFEDDGKEVKIKLARPTPGFASMIGTIKRTDSAADPQKLTGLKLEGKLTVTFQGFPKPQTATVRVILDDENTMRWILPDWPIVIRTNIYRTAEKIILTRGGAFPGKR